jgi:hypothetical protein
MRRFPLTQPDKLPYYTILSLSPRCLGAIMHLRKVQGRGRSIEVIIYGATGMVGQGTVRICDGDCRPGPLEVG